MKKNYGGNTPIAPKPDYSRFSVLNLEGDRCCVVTHSFDASDGGLSSSFVVNIFAHRVDAERYCKILNDAVNEFFK